MENIMFFGEYSGLIYILSFLLLAFIIVVVVLAAKLRRKSGRKPKKRESIEDVQEKYARWLKASSDAAIYQIEKESKKMDKEHEKLMKRLNRFH